MQNNVANFDIEGPRRSNDRVTWIPAPSHRESSFIPHRDEINVEFQPPTPPRHQTPPSHGQHVAPPTTTRGWPFQRGGPRVFGLFGKKNRRNESEPQRGEPEPWVFHHPARDDPNFPPFDVLNLHSSAIFDRARNPVLAMRSRTPSIGSFYEEMHNLRREALFDQEDEHRAAQRLPPMDRAAAVRDETRRGDQMRERGFGRSQSQARPERSDPNYHPPPWTFEAPPSSTTESRSLPVSRPGPLERLLSFRHAGTGPSRIPLEPDVHPLQDPYTRSDRDPGGREFILEPYMDAQASVPGTPNTRSRIFEPTIQMPEPRPSTMAGELVPHINYNTGSVSLTPPRRLPARKFRRRQEQNESQYSVIPTPISPPTKSRSALNLISPPPEPVIHENTYNLPRERWRVPIPSWNVFGGARKFPRWGRREQQNAVPTPLSPPHMQLQPESTQEEEAEEREPIVVPELPPRSVSSDETLTEHSPLPRSMEAGPSTVLPPALAAAEPPVKPQRSFVPTSIPSTPASRARSPIVHTKQVHAAVPSDGGSSSRISSPGFDRSVSTSSPAPMSRFIPFHIHVDQLIDVIKSVKNLPWMADRITVDYVPPVRPNPRLEAQAREYLAPPPPEQTTWYTGAWHERKDRPKKKPYRERIVTMMVQHTPQAQPNLRLSNTDSFIASQAASATLLDHTYAGRAIPVHSRKGALRQAALNQPVQVVQSSFPPSSVMYPPSHPYSSTATGNMIGSDGRVFDYAHPSTFFVFPQTASNSNPMPTPPTFSQPEVIYTPRPVRLRYQV